MSVQRRIRNVAALVAVLAIGCSGHRSDEFSSRVMDLLFPISGNGFTTDVGGSDSLRTGFGTFAVTFSDRTITDASRFRTCTVTTSLDSDVTLTVPEGEALPSSFTLKNLDLMEIYVADTAGARSMTKQGFANGPIQFNRVGTTNTYRATSNVRILFTSIIDGTDLTNLLAVVQDAPSDNVCSGLFGYEISNSVPAGATIAFTFGPTSGSVSLN